MHRTTIRTTYLSRQCKPCSGSVVTAGKQNLQLKAKAIHDKYGLVKFVPRMGRNLLSIGQMTKDPDVNILFNDDKCIIKRGQDFIAIGQRGSDNLYHIEDVNAEEVNDVTQEYSDDDGSETGSSSGSDVDSFINYEQHNPERDWDRRLGHLSKNGLKHLVRMGIIPIGKNDLNKRLDCVICAQAKAHALNYKKRPKSSKARTNSPGELVYFNTCGPFSIPDINDDLFFQTYIDDISRLTVTFLMKAKSQTMSNIVSYKSFMDNRGYSNNTLRTD